MKPYIRFFIAIALLLSLKSTHATTTYLADSTLHSLSFQAGIALNDTNHYFYRRHNPDHRNINKNIAFHLRYSFAFAPESRLGQLYPTAYQGIGFASYSFFAPNSMGSPLCAYLFQGSKILDLADRFSLGYEWNVGFSWGWIPNKASVSKHNVMLNVSLPLTWHITPRWELALVPYYTHFSNGDTKFPNSGVDAFGMQARVTYNFHTQHVSAPGMRYLAPHPYLQGCSFSDHISWDLILYGGWRADRFFSDGYFCLINEPIPNWGLQLNPLYHLNQYFSIGASLDILTDRSANLCNAEINHQTGACIGYSTPSLWQQTAIALSIRGEIRMPFFSIGVGAGMNVVQHGYDMERFYSMFGLKMFLSRRTFLYLGYRLCALQYTRNIMYGFGYRFGAGAR